MDFDGRLTGLITADQLASIPPRARARALVRLGQVALAVPPVYRAAPTDPAAPLLTPPPAGRQILAVVLENGRVAGLVTIEDLQRAVRRARLTTASA